MSFNIGSIEDLYRCNPTELERQANIILYGSAELFSEALDREIFRRGIYVPRGLNEPLVYKVPKLVRWRLTCAHCNRLRSDMGGNLCSFCYRLKARLRFYDAREGMDYWERQMYGGFDEDGNHCGVSMPTVEWWDNRDIPSTPNRIAIARWNLDK